MYLSSLPKKSSMKKFLFKHWEILLLFVFSLTALLWLKPGEVIMGHDSGFRLNFLSYYKSLLYAWNPIVNFGVDWQLYKGFLTTQFSEFIFTVLSDSWVIGQRMMMVFWFFVIQASMYVLTKTIRPEKDRWVFRIGASTFYAFNFFILQGWFIVERAKFSLYAALPISILLFYRVFVQKKNVLSNAILFGILYFFCTGGGSAPLYGGTLVAWFVTYVFFTFSLWRQEKWKGLLFSLYVLFAFGNAFVLINAYWIVPQIGLYVSTYTSAVAERGGIDGLIAWERVNSKNASILNLLRLQGVPDWYDNPSHPFSKAFLTNPILIAASFIPSIIVLLGIVMSYIKKIKHNQIIIIASILLAIGLILGGGSHPPFGLLYEYAMRHVPGFAIFRSSFYKFGPILWFSMILLSLYFLESFLYSFWKNKKAYTIVGICVVAAILSYHYPFFTKNIFQFHSEFTTKVRVPPYIEDMAKFANANTDPYARIMVLPELTSSFYNVQMDAYTWNFFSLDIFPRNAIDRSIIANDNNAPDVIARLYTEYMDGDPQAFQKLAGLMGIRYLLWRDDAKYSTGVIDGRTLAFQKEKLQPFSSKLVYKSGLWELYDLGSEVNTPLVWSPESVSVTQHAIPHPLELLFSLSQENNAVIEGTTLPEDVIEATCLYCELGVYDKMVRETPVPSLRFSPKSILFQKLIFSDKKALKNAGTNPEAVFNASISHAQFQLAVLSANDKPKDYDQKEVIRDITSSYDRARDELSTLSGHQKNVYSLRLLLYSDVSKGFISGLNTLSDEDKQLLLSYFETLSKDIFPSVWMTREPTDIHYEFEIPEDSSYSIILTNVYSIPQLIEVDGVLQNTLQPLQLKSGYHIARITYPSTVLGFAPQLFLRKDQASLPQRPSITFTKNNPIKYSVTVKDALDGYLLILNEGFDKRWKVKVSGEKAYIDEKYHGKANGFGNAWYIEKPGTYSLEIVYQPQQLFILGASMSCISLLLGIAILKKVK